MATPKLGPIPLLLEKFPMDDADEEDDDEDDECGGGGPAGGGGGGPSPLKSIPSLFNGEDSDL